MEAPTLVGIHHITIPVTDIEHSMAWFRTVLGASHTTALDHIDSAGIRFAVIVTVPGISVPVMLRWAPVAAQALRECDVLALAVHTDADLEAWIAHLDTTGAEHSPVIAGGAGSVVVIADPDSQFIRLMTTPTHSEAGLSVAATPLDPHGPWLNPVPMQYPGSSQQRAASTEGTAS
jgi:catechol 2,3-dioxygenase-like lactoylglutathione lyase family enzyme